ncbi:hypothetical protein FZEAL_1922 [Fusarium zealandicum]|uniref:AB hydrolase-1 domain-containing protein n=1 Tax=Fusarium zealandicum TaxID=1053134 RepID=A0A8H4URS3_9HYPO|nr:hypothetical protein FZEAL_1922 [Fusarium zealandicum]
MAQTPTLVLVPGAWHSPDTWGKIVSAMEPRDFKCVPVALPTTSSSNAKFSDDVKAVRESVLAETTQGRDVVVVVHSYGGAVGSSAIKGLTLKGPHHSSSTDKASGHVIGFFMIASGFMVGGVTFLDGLGGKPPPSWDADYENNVAALKVDIRELFYHDLSEEEGDYWVGRIQSQSLKAFTEGAEDAYAGWMEVPVWYLATTEDRALPIEAQRFFVQGAKDAGGDVTLREIESSHSPMLSKPDETVKVLMEGIESFVA